MTRRSDHLARFSPLLLLGLAWAPGEDPVQEPRETLEVALTQASHDPLQDLGPVEVDAAELWKRPTAHLDHPLRLRVQMRGRLDSWNPFTTRFGDGEFSAWSAWGDRQFPWVEEQFRNPVARLFARRDSAAEWALENGKAHDRFELVGVVRTVFAGRPWFEVLSVKPLVRDIGEGCVLHASRALELMEQEAWQSAIAELERASSEGLPAHARAELERLVEECREGLARTPRSPRQD